MDAGVGRGGGGESGPSQLKKPSKFTVYQNPAISAVLTANSLQPSNSTLFLVFSLSSASAVASLSIAYRENGLLNMGILRNVSEEAAYFLAKALQILVVIVFIGSVLALAKVISLCRTKNVVGVLLTSSSKETKNQPRLTIHQLELLGIKPNVQAIEFESSKKPPKSETTPSASDILVPIHQPVSVSNNKSRVASEKSGVGSANKMTSYSTPSMSQSSPSSLYLVPGISSPLSSAQTSPGMNSAVSTPWSSKRLSSAKEIATEEQLEQFLAEVDQKITESAWKLGTPPATSRGVGIVSPGTVSSPASASGTARSTPLRPVRMSPGSQKYTTPPKKGDGDLPPPMSMEESIEAFKNLGIYPQIEQWRDYLRQWFSSVLLNPLLHKIETSHIEVMQAAAKLGVLITINPVGSDPPTSGTTATVSSMDRKEWQPAFALDEDGILHQLCATLVQALDASTPKLIPANLQQPPQKNPMIAAMQECVDAITEHQRLDTLMKGEWGKGLLPHSNVREDYMVQRIHELAEGTCVKNYEYLGNGEVYDKKNKKWTLELPTDSQVLLYLFCAFLEHPKWMLHVDPTSYAGAQSSKNPLFLGVLPPKERFPEKYISVISGVPSVLHPGACILVVGKQSPPIFGLYWDKKLQFSLQVCR
uniref:Uncharacterized protein MANES_04G024400 n=1 Tax=Rhizophora mucronata TaxID=61149 RepID=A0A2P2JQY0_RHIMU